MTIKLSSIKQCSKTKQEIRNSIHKVGSDSESFWRNFLNQKKAQKKLCIVKQSADGNCLFHSLSKYIMGMDARQLRKKIVEFEGEKKKFQIVQMMLVDKPDEIPEYEEYLFQHGLEFQLLSKPQKLDIYLKVMKKNGVYGQNLEIKAFTDLFNLNVIILKSGNVINVVIPDAGVADHSIFLTYSGIHYDVLYVEQDNVEKKCITKTVLNPKTGNCISKNSPLGIKISKEKCQKPSVINPETGRCVRKSSRIGKKLSKVKNIETCKEETKLNRKSGRCVKKK